MKFVKCISCVKYFLYFDYTKNIWTLLQNNEIFICNCLHTSWFDTWITYMFYLSRKSGPNKNGKTVFTTAACSTTTELFFKRALIKIRPIAVCLSFLHFYFSCLVLLWPLRPHTCNRLLLERDQRILFEHQFSRRPYAWFRSKTLNFDANVKDGEYQKSFLYVWDSPYWMLQVFTIPN